MTTMNGIEVENLKKYVESIRQDRSVADRNPVVTAHWEGETRARVEVKGAKGFYLGGDDDMSAMEAVIGALGACDVEVVSTHAALMGLEIRDLRVEATGNFNIASLLGIASPTDAAYDKISYKIVVDAPGATADQIEALGRACEMASPVGDSLRKAIPLTFELQSA